MRNPIKHFYEFGSFRLEAEKRRLLKDGEQIPLSPKAIELLTVMVQNPGKLLERQELLQAVWSDSLVEDGNLSVAISQLRKALGQNSEASEYIETIPRVGYRFVAKVRQVSQEFAPLVIEKHTLSKTVIEEEFLSDGSHLKERGITVPPVPKVSDYLLRHHWTSVLVICAGIVVVALGVFLFRKDDRQTGLVSNRWPVSIRSIVVLPPKALGSAGENASLSLGMADALITKLGSIHRINVRPTSAIIRYVDANPDALEVGRSMGVDAVLDGSLQRENGRLRLTLRMIYVADGSQLWTSTFDESDTNVFKLQDMTSQEVASALFHNLSQHERDLLSKQQTTDPEAYAAYLKGNYFWSKRGDEAKKSIDYFRRAIELDSNFAEAYVGLALVNATNTSTSPEAEALIERALQLNDSLAEAHASKGLIRIFQHWDWAGGRSELDRAIELNPNSATAHHWKGVYFSLRGQLEEAKAEMHRALELDPLSLIITADIGQLHYFAHEYEQALNYCNRALALDPGFQIAHQYLFDIYRAKGMETEALLERPLFELPGSSPENVARVRDIYLKEGFQTTVRRHIAGYMSKTATEQRVSAIIIGKYHIMLGNNEEALRWLEISLERPGFLLPFMNVDPLYDPLRSEPRFRALLARMKLEGTRS